MGVTFWAIFKENLAMFLPTQPGELWINGINLSKRAEFESLGCQAKDEQLEGGRVQLPRGL